MHHFDFADARQFDWRFRLWVRTRVFRDPARGAHRGAFNRFLARRELMEELHESLLDIHESDDAAERFGSLSDLFQWFLDHWEEILEIIMTLLNL